MSEITRLRIVHKAGGIVIIKPTQAEKIKMFLVPTDPIAV
jgi:hypothetical protein